jgi:hypothetical protein
MNIQEVIKKLQPENRPEPMVGWVLSNQMVSDMQEAIKEEVSKREKAEEACAEMRVAIDEAFNFTRWENTRHALGEIQRCLAPIVEQSKTSIGQGWISPKSFSKEMDKMEQKWNEQGERIKGLERQLAITTATLEQRTNEANLAAALAKSQQEQLAEARKDVKRVEKIEKLGEEVAERGGGFVITGPMNLTGEKWMINGGEPQATFREAIDAAKGGE